MMTCQSGASVKSQAGHGLGPGWHIGERPWSVAGGGATHRGRRVPFGRVTAPLVRSLPREPGVDKTCRVRRRPPCRQCVGTSGRTEAAAQAPVVTWRPRLCSPRTCTGRMLLGTLMQLLTYDGRNGQQTPRTLRVFRLENAAMRASPTVSGPPRPRSSAREPDQVSLSFTTPLKSSEAHKTPIPSRRVPLSGEHIDRKSVV